jgi:hypothetical protein
LPPWAPLYDPGICLLVLVGTGLRFLEPQSNAQTLGPALSATNLDWTTGGDTNWFVETDITISDNAAAAQSGFVTQRHETWIQTTVTNGPGTLSFWWNVETEPYDGLEFSINGQVIDTISSHTFWEYRTYQIPAGSQTLKWRYYRTQHVGGYPPTRVIWMR